MRGLILLFMLTLAQPLTAQEPAAPPDEPQRFEDEVTVSATRTDKRLEDQPMRVEVLDREEIEEKLLMTPGDIVMMLNEMGGMRVQATSPSLGAASVRIQGMRGRYTRFLSDGLPLFGEQVGGLGLLQIPPMDLGRVEVIKGVASSLYGAGAMGGVVNLISRRAGEQREGEFLFNRSTRNGTDSVVWHAAPLSPQWGLTLLGGGHWQRQVDVNDDVWSDIPGYSRGILRPRVSWSNHEGKSFFATTGVTVENRRGGTLDGATLPAAGSPYVESLNTRRFDVGAIGQTLVGRQVLNARFAVAYQRHDHRFGEVRERDTHQTAFGELTIRGARGRNTWVAGAAIEREAYRPRDLDRFRFTHVIPGVFIQDDLDLSSLISLSASGRLDRHSEYGTFFNPRLSVLFRWDRWNSRLSVGTGFFGPSALTEETEAAGLSRLIIPSALRAERGRSASIDLTRTDGPASYTVTLFTSRVAHPIHVERSSSAYVMTNLLEPASTHGMELLGTFRRAQLSLTATYTYVRARERTGQGPADIPLTPRHSSGLVGMWEREDAGRVGVEWYYTGAQRLDDNPYRTRSEPYFIVGVLAERRLGRFRLFVNVENLNDIRQTAWDPLTRPERSADGRWTVDGWAPLEGRTINGGLRLQF